MTAHPQVPTEEFLARIVCVLVLVGVVSGPAPAPGDDSGALPFPAVSEQFRSNPQPGGPLFADGSRAHPESAAVEPSFLRPLESRTDEYVAEPERAEPGIELRLLDALRQDVDKLKAATAHETGYGRGMTLVLDDEGKKYIRFLSWLQMWTAFTDNNPGTVDAYGEPQDCSLDIGIRRARFLMYSQLTERYLILMHLGINNQTFTNGGGGGYGDGATGIGGYGAGKKPQIFFHDLWNEYAIIAPSDCRDFSLATGVGLHFWNGVSRKASASTANFMTVDAMVYNWENIEYTDQFARQLGWYFKGKLSKLDYRLSINQPYNADGRAALNTERAVNIATRGLAFAGYFEWEFWDQESNLLPYKTSTWLGTKRVFNLGAGFYAHPEASGILDAGGQLHKQTQSAVGIDAYLDTPVGKCDAALTVYAVQYFFDYGKNYYRDIGIMNTGTLGSAPYLAANGITPAISGAGNAQPLFGTGDVFYLEAGYLLPSWILGGSHGRLQPFGALAAKHLDWLSDTAYNYDMGLNYLIDGHRAKLTFQYSLRPQFILQTDGGVTRRVADGHGGEFIIQAQVAL